MSFFSSYTDRKKIKFSSYIRKFRWDFLQSHIWLTASSYMTKYLRIFSYIKKPLLIYDLQQIPSEFPYTQGKLSFFFFQCIFFFTLCSLLKEERHTWSPGHLCSIEGRGWTGAGPKCRLSMTPVIIFRAMNRWRYYWFDTLVNIRLKVDGIFPSVERYCQMKTELCRN